jgi:hypothetical protein
MKLHLGCGTKRLEGWINIDAVGACQPDLVHDIMSPLPYGDSTADEILAEDLLEHFDKYARYIVFYEWARVLRIGGKITVQVPNFKKLLFRYFKFGYDRFVDAVFGENLWESRIYIGHFGNHKWGYSRKTLEEFVQAFGIVAVKTDEIGLNLRLQGVKRRHVSWADLDAIPVYSQANKCGKGEGYVSLRSAREKMQCSRENLDLEQSLR